MGLYYLEHLAVTSQIKDHKVAFQTSVNALKTFKAICDKCIKLDSMPNEHRIESVFVDSHMLEELAHISEEAET